MTKKTRNTLVLPDIGFAVSSGRLSTFRMVATMTKKTRNTFVLPDVGFADGCEAGLRPAVYLVFKEGSAPGTGLARTKGKAQDQLGVLRRGIAPPHIHRRSRKQRPSIHFQDGGYDD
jgi:hypothetical protein